MQPDQIILQRQDLVSSHEIVVVVFIVFGETLCCSNDVSLLDVNTIACLPDGQHTATAMEEASEGLYERLISVRITGRK